MIGVARRVPARVTRQNLVTSLPRGPTRTTETLSVSRVSASLRPPPTGVRPQVSAACRGARASLDEWISIFSVGVWKLESMECWSPTRAAGPPPRRPPPHPAPSRRAFARTGPPELSEPWRAHTRSHGHSMAQRTGCAHASRRGFQKRGVGVGSWASGSVVIVPSYIDSSS